jgi:hypothetical protein
LRLADAGERVSGLARLETQTRDAAAAVTVAITLEDDVP